MNRLHRGKLAHIRYLSVKLNGLGKKRGEKKGSLGKSFVLFVFLFLNSGFAELQRRRGKNKTLFPNWIAVKEWKNTLCCFCFLIFLLYFFKQCLNRCRPASWKVTVNASSFCEGMPFLCGNHTILFWIKPKASFSVSEWLLGFFDWKR